MKLVFSWVYGIDGFFLSVREKLGILWRDADICSLSRVPQWDLLGLPMRVSS
jgi:hypothetical protein